MKTPRRKHYKSTKYSSDVYNRESGPLEIGELETPRDRRSVPVGTLRYLAGSKYQANHVEGSCASENSDYTDARSVESETDPDGSPYYAERSVQRSIKSSNKSSDLKTLNLKPGKTTNTSNNFAREFILRYATNLGSEVQYAQNLKPQESLFHNMDYIHSHLSSFNPNFINFNYGRLGYTSYNPLIHRYQDYSQPTYINKYPSYFDKFSSYLDKHQSYFDKNPYIDKYTSSYVNRYQDGYFRPENHYRANYTYRHENHLIHPENHLVHPENYGIHSENRVIRPGNHVVLPGNDGINSQNHLVLPETYLERNNISMYSDNRVNHNLSSTNYSTNVNYSSSDHGTKYSLHNDHKYYLDKYGYPLENHERDRNYRENKDKTDEKKEIKNREIDHTYHTGEHTGDRMGDHTGDNRGDRMRDHTGDNTGDRMRDYRMRKRDVSLKDENLRELDGIDSEVIRSVVEKAVIDAFDRCLSEKIKGEETCLTDSVNREYTFDKNDTTLTYQEQTRLYSHDLQRLNEQNNKGNSDIHRYTNLSLYGNGKLHPNLYGNGNLHLNSSLYGNVKQYTNGNLYGNVNVYEKDLKESNVNGVSGLITFGDDFSNAENQDKDKSTENNFKFKTEDHFEHSTPNNTFNSHTKSYHNSFNNSYTNTSGDAYNESSGDDIYTEKSVDKCVHIDVYVEKDVNEDKVEEFDGVSYKFQFNKGDEFEYFNGDDLFSNRETDDLFYPDNEHLNPTRNDFEHCDTFSEQLTNQDDKSDLSSHHFDPIHLNNVNNMNNLNNLDHMNLNVNGLDQLNNENDVEEMYTMGNCFANFNSRDDYFRANYKDLDMSNNPAGSMLSESDLEEQENLDTQVTSFDPENNYQQCKQANFDPNQRADSLNSSQNMNPLDTSVRNVNPLNYSQSKINQLDNSLSKMNPLDNSLRNVNQLEKMKNVSNFEEKKVSDLGTFRRRNSFSFKNLERRRGGELSGSNYLYQADTDNTVRSSFSDPLYRLNSPYLKNQTTDSETNQHQYTQHSHSSNLKKLQSGMSQDLHISARVDQLEACIKSFESCLRNISDQLSKSRGGVESGSDSPSLELTASQKLPKPEHVSDLEYMEAYKAALAIKKLLHVKSMGSLIPAFTAFVQNRKG